MSIDAMRIIAVQPKHLYCAGALYWKSPRRFLSGENVREGLEQVSRVMANNQSQQWGRKKFNKVVQAWRRLKGPKKSKWGSNIWVIASSPICLNRGANWRSIVFSHYFVISCTFYVNRPPKMLRDIFIWQFYFVLYTKIPSLDKFITSQFHGSWKSARW